MLQPVVRWLARHHIPPPVTVILIVTLMFLGAARVGLLIEANVRWLFSQGQREVEVEVEGLDPISEEQQELAKQFDWDLLVERFHEWMLDREFPELFAQVAYDSVREANVEAFAAEIIGSGLGFIRGLVLVVIYMLFIFAEQAVFRRKILSIFEKRRDDAQTVLDNIGRGIQRYLGVKTVTSFATGALCYAVLVSLGVPFAILLGFLTFALNYIPTFGSIIAGAVATFVAIVTVPEPGLTTPVIVVITYLAVNVTLGNYVEPKILGRELNLSPLVVIISVVVWAPIAVMLSSGPPKEKKGSKKPPPATQAA
jgi:predicted PurR-regulated permease PerM